MERYAIRRFEPGAAFRFGCVIGAVLLIVPGIVAGIAVHSAIVVLLGWLESWQAWNIELRGISLYEINLLDKLQLSAVADTLRSLAERGAWIIIPTVAAGLIGLGGLWTGVSTLLTALIYNGLAVLSGGLIVRAEKLTYLPAPAPLPPAPPVAMLPPAGVWLVMIANPTQRWPLHPGVTTLGSAPGNQIVLNGLAPRHAEIRLEQGRYILYDFNEGQTWVNNRQVAGSNMMKDGFVLRLGVYEFTFYQR